MSNTILTLALSFLCFRLQGNSLSLRHPVGRNCSLHHSGLPLRPIRQLPLHFQKETQTKETCQTWKEKFALQWKRFWLVRLLPGSSNQLRQGNVQEGDEQQSSQRCQGNCWQTQQGIRSSGKEFIEYILFFNTRESARDEKIRCKPLGAMWAWRPMRKLFVSLVKISEGAAAVSISC